MHLGMTGLDSAIKGNGSLRSGMATVPVTHSLHTISARTSDTARVTKTRFKEMASALAFKPAAFAFAA